MTFAGESARPGSVEDWAHRTPDAVALREGERSLSYRELNDSANRVAAVMARRAQVAPGDRVAVCTKNRLEWFVSQTAIA
ncbi:MAG TPA: AMP-binding protein, partial [Polyangiaceae bacterium]|nr:AMP-binding protein [Polyangiaceae bacterium]